MQFTDQNINVAIEDTQTFFEKSGVSHKDLLKICLAMEEILLRYQAHFGSEHEFDVYKKNWFKMPRVIIRIAGEPFYPPHKPNINDVEPANAILSDEIMARLLNYEATRITYRYDGGFNEINFFSMKERKPIKIPGGSITISIVLACICSVLMDFLSPDVQNILITDIVSPVLSSLMSLIVTVTVFMMFFSIVASICAIDDSTTLGNIGSTVTVRFFIIDLLIIAITMAVSEMFFPIMSISGESSIDIKEIIDLLLSIVPTNILEAFSKANILQVTVMAFLTGICIIMLGNRVSNLKNMFIDLNALIFKIMEIVLKIIPLTIFLCILKTLSTSDFADFIVVWRIVLAILIVYTVFAIVMLIRLSIKSKMNISDFLKKISSVFIIALTTASSIATLPKNLEVSKEKLHIEEKFSKFWFPLAVALFSPHFVIQMTVSAFYVMQVSGNTISIMQLLIIAFLAIQISIAAPKVAGGSAIGFGILLTQLELPMELIGTLMIANVLLDNVCTALTILTLDCELYSVAYKLNFIKMSEEN